MPHKNSIYTVTSRDITREGMGVGTADDMAVFVNGLLPEETAEVRVIKVLKNYAVGRVEKLVSPSPFRAEAVCPVFKECGGCTHMFMNYSGQLKYKTAHVASCLKKFSGTNLEPQACVPSPKDLYYRNKISLPVEKSAGSLKIGCYKNRSHTVVDAPVCHIADKEFIDITKAVREFLTENDISIYDEAAHKGLVRHIVLRKSSLSQIMVGIVINGTSLKYADKLIDKLSLFDAVKTVVVNINREKGNVILGKETFPIYGSGRIREKILNCVFDISLNTFLQVNHAQTEQLYSHALSLLGSDANVVCDLYCGAGTITLNAAKKAGRIYGVEIVPQAIEDAEKNAVLNGITNAEFICADCAEAFPQIIEKEGHIDAVIVDPPRKGLAPSVVTDIAKSGAAKVVYVSCDPATLARDIKLFTENGYIPISATPFDMFPQTGHVETVVLLSNGNAF